MFINRHQVPAGADGEPTNLKDPEDAVDMFLGPLSSKGKDLHERKMREFAEQLRCFLTVENDTCFRGGANAVLSIISSSVVGDKRDGVSRPLRRITRLRSLSAGAMTIFAMPAAQRAPSVMVLIEIVAVTNGLALAVVGWLDDRTMSTERDTQLSLPDRVRDFTFVINLVTTAAFFLHLFGLIIVLFAAVWTVAYASAKSPPYQILSGATRVQESIFITSFALCLNIFAGILKMLKDFPWVVGIPLAVFVFVFFVLIFAMVVIMARVGGPLILWHEPRFFHWIYPPFAMCVDLESLASMQAYTIRLNVQQQAPDMWQLLKALADEEKKQ